jgi:hypothetical protein
VQNSSDWAAISYCTCVAPGYMEDAIIEFSKSLQDGVMFSYTDSVVSCTDCYLYAFKGSVIAMRTTSCVPDPDWVYDHGRDAILVEDIQDDDDDFGEEWILKEISWQ